jgi:hypothetical protein
MERLLHAIIRISGTVFAIILKHNRPPRNRHATSCEIISLPDRPDGIAVEGV